MQPAKEHVIRDWFEEHLRSVLRGRAADVPVRPLKLERIKRKARVLVLAHAVAALVLALCLTALLLID